MSARHPRTSVSAALAAALVAISPLFSLCASPAARPAGAAPRAAPRAPVAASRPALSGPASAPEANYPSPELSDACRKTAADLGTKLDDSFTLTVRPPFVIAGNLSKAALERAAADSVVRPAEVMWKCYFRQRPREPITILLLADGKSYARWADRLFGDKDVPHFGYYKPASRTMVMDLSTGAGTLVHELTHALMAADFPGVPDWFNEGLASLHEGCEVREDRIVGLVNWRLPALREAAGKGTLRPLEELLTADDFYGAQRGLNYAQARYFCLYAQQKGLLEKLYSRLRDAPAGKRAGVTAVEEVFGRKIGQVEKEYLAWVKALP